MFLLKLAMRPWKLAFWSQAVSALSTGLLMSLVGLLVWLDQGMEPLMHRLGHDQVITAYLTDGLEVSEELTIKDTIQKSLGAHPMDLKLMTSQQFVEDLGADYPDLAQQLLTLGGDSLHALVPNMVSISGVLPQGALEKIKGIEGVESAESSQDRFGQIIGAFGALRWVARALAVGVLLALISNLAHLGRMNAHLHRDALGLVRLLGGDGLQSRFPPWVSIMSVGSLGGVMAAAMWWAGGPWCMEQIRLLSPHLAEITPPTRGLMVGALALGGCLSGIVAGLFWQKEKSV